MRSDRRKRYREFTIPKKSGGERRILAPRPGLKLLQTKINGVLQEVYRPRMATFGFVRSRNIRMNAEQHVGNRWVFNVDLRDFFPSINFGRVRGLFISQPYELPPSVATVIAQVCCHDNQLPQGAPTSPVLSNMICRRMDNELLSLSRKHSSVYTRYADDITLSSNRQVFPVALATSQDNGFGGATGPGLELLSVVQNNGFQINDDKSRLQRRTRRQTVTGLLVNEKVNVPRSYVRELRGMLHAWERYGMKAAQDTFERRYFRPQSRAPFMPTPSLFKVIGGKISHLGDVRGKTDPLYLKYREWFRTLLTNS